MSSIIRGDDDFDSAYGAALKAWVNFNGTGTVAIRASLNVTSITDNGTGNYTVNLTVPLLDSNYACSVTSGGTNSHTTTAVSPREGSANGAGSVSIGIRSVAGSDVDVGVINVSVFR